MGKLPKAAWHGRCPSLPERTRRLLHVASPGGTGVRGCNPWACNPALWWWRAERRGDEAALPVVVEYRASQHRGKGVLVVDGSGFPKKGDKSVGVQRQWCGRLGKEENCQVGEFLAYAGGGSYMLLDGELYLPRSWLTRRRRKEGKIPKALTFRTRWEIVAALLQKHGASVPHAWVTGDEDYGVPNAFRDLLHHRKETYILEVKLNTRVWLANAGGDTLGTLLNVGRVAQQIAPARWRRLHVRDGEKEPIEVEATRAWVVTPRDNEKDQRVETLVLVRKPDGSKMWQLLTNAPKGTPLSEMVRAASCRHAIEELLELGKGDVGLDEYEVRSYRGWHHHLTLTMLALWFTVKQHLELEKNSDAHRSTTPMGYGFGDGK